MMNIPIMEKQEIREMAKKYSVNSYSSNFPKDHVLLSITEEAFYEGACWMQQVMAEKDSDSTDSSSID